MTEENKSKKRYYKLTTKLRDEIVNLVREENPTKTGIAKRLHVCKDSITNWLRDDEELRARYAEAVNEFFQALEPIAVNSLRKLVEGYDVEESRTVYIDNGMGEPMVKEKTVTKRHIEPSMTAIQFTLTNANPKKYDK